MELIAMFPPLTLVFIIGVMILTLYFHGPSYSSHTANNAPALLTGFGIFGTFLGVALGLLEFDANNIENGVPALMDGLKTAFWSSIAGLLGALTIKLRHVMHVIHHNPAKSDIQAATIDDLANLLAEIHKSLAADGEEGLAYQLQRSRIENNQGWKQLRESLDSYEEKMVEANSKALISALESIMRDFNTQIDAQYGDNFRQLNQAVGNMLDWQRAYADQLNELIEAQKINGAVISEATHAYEKVVSYTEVFKTVSESLGSMLEGLETQSKSLDSYLTGLSQLVGTASQGLPALDGRVTALTEQLSQSIQENNERLQMVLEHTAKNIQETVEQVNNDLSTAVFSAHQGLYGRVEDVIERTEEQLLKFDASMEQELNKALRTFGYQLTALSEKFVNDYTPLTDKLRDLVEIAAEVEVG